MKPIFTLIAFVLFTANIFAQAPEKMSYQAVVRDQNGNLKTNTTIGVQITINKDGGLFPTLVYTERHTATTNENGLISLEIGTGTVINGNFSTIDWGNGSYTLNTNYDLTGGTNYSLIGSSKLLSVPYALYAKNAGNAIGGNTCPNGTTVGEIKYWNGTSWITVAPALDGKVLTLEGGMPVWKDNSITVNLPQVNTLTTTNITNVSATYNGYVISAGGGKIAERGFCYATTSNPTIFNKKVLVSGELGSFTASIPGLDIATTYYVRSYCTNSAGTSYGDEVSFKTTVLVGDNYQGGIVACVFEENDMGYVSGETHGFIAAPSDQSSGIVWHSTNDGVTNAVGLIIGRGYENTNKIISLYGDEQNAARICSDLILNGYSDWYLPSLSEMIKILILGKGIYEGAGYWTSTETNSSNAQGVDSNGGAKSYAKNNLFRVRAIRYF